MTEHYSQINNLFGFFKNKNTFFEKKVKECIDLYQEISKKKLIINNENYLSDDISSLDHSTNEIRNSFSNIKFSNKNYNFRKKSNFKNISLMPLELVSPALKKSKFLKKITLLENVNLAESISISCSSKENKKNTNKSSEKLSEKKNNFNTSNKETLSLNISSNIFKRNTDNINNSKFSKSKTLKIDSSSEHLSINIEVKEKYTNESEDRCSINFQNKSANMKPLDICSRENVSINMEEEKISNKSQEKNKEEMLKDKFKKNLSIKSGKDFSSRSTNKKKTNTIWFDDFYLNPKKEKDYFVESAFSDNNNSNKSLITSGKASNEEIITINDFEFIKLISKGAYGKVWLVKKINTGDIYAMKIVNFANKMTKNNIDDLKKENEIFKKLKGDFIVKCIYTFIHEHFICFVMEYLYGGDLEKYGCFDEDIARFYIAELIEAVESLHNLGIIHRDLKPENLLLDGSGHLKLTDFGLSDLGVEMNIKNNLENKSDLYIDDDLKKQMNFLNVTTKDITFKTNNDSTIFKKKSKIYNNSKIIEKRIIGTPDYISPEIILGLGSNHSSVDWWSVGVILFEFLVGIPPFNENSIEKIFENIKQINIPWDEITIGNDNNSVSYNAYNLINKFLTFNPENRIGSNGINEIKQHKFFDNFDWDNLKNKKAPILPVILGINDTNNFQRNLINDNEENTVPFQNMTDSIKLDDNAKIIL